ncbi:hypothetical protein JF544_13535 [Halobacillus kuroshimensis]|uniref:Uncharacterized protein n=1 Tax=Halobacillus kuroshimensis TaxID=302481 RepID=A0ABS3DY84_9BACI|nr:hypothetical protein [Halobacillus kuroshimensis]MBN8236283.1 hypothetical protein [Halobacillus kuroshimensis]
MAKKAFERFLVESFQEGIFFRELRLSEKEVTRLKKLYPSAEIKQTSPVDAVLRKSWYEVNLDPDARTRKSYDCVVWENLQLKREIEKLKNHHLKK